MIFETENQTESDIFQFKFSTNRESSDFLHIETENLTEREFFQIKDFNKQKNFRIDYNDNSNKPRKFRLFTN